MSYVYIWQMRTLYVIISKKTNSIKDIIHSIQRYTVFYMLTVLDLQYTS